MPREKGEKRLRIPREVRRVSIKEVLPQVERVRTLEASEMARPSLPGGPQGNDAFRVLTKRQGRWKNLRPEQQGGPDDEDTKLKHQAQNYAGIFSFVGMHIVARLGVGADALITGTFLTPLAKVVAPMLLGYSASRFDSALKAFFSGQPLSGIAGIATSGVSMLGGCMVSVIALTTANPAAIVGAGGFWIGLYIGNANKK